MLSRVLSPSSWLSLFRALRNIRNINRLQLQVAEQDERIKKLEVMLNGRQSLSHEQAGSEELTGLQARVDNCEISLQNLQPRVDKSEIQQSLWAEQMVSREQTEAMISVKASQLIHYQIQSVQQRIDQQVFDREMISTDQEAKRDKIVAETVKDSALQPEELEN